MRHLIRRAGTTREEVRMSEGWDTKGKNYSEKRAKNLATWNRFSPDS